MRIRVGMGQLLVEGGEPQRNMERAVRMVKESAEAGCKIILLPECLDLAWTHPSVHVEAEGIPGERSKILSEAAIRYDIWICAGLTERSEHEIFNSAILIDSEGKIRLKYRKINLLEVEQPFYEVGSELRVLDTPFGRIGLNICADNYWDGLTIGHTLARMGAQIILSPSSWTVDYSTTEQDNPYGVKWLGPYRQLCSLYGLVMVGTTSVGMIIGGPYQGKKMVGCSLAVGPDGILAQGPYNEFSGELVIAEFEVPQRKEKGTAIGEMLRKKGYQLS